MTTVSCIICRKALENPFGSVNQPDGGTAFATGGHYGSTVFDPMDGTQLEINVCDECLTAAASAALVLHHHWGSRLSRLRRLAASRLSPTGFNPG